MGLVLNIDGNQLCPICLNEGWVTLKGTMVSLGVTYEKGMTSCKWCQLGARLYQRTDRRGSMGRVPPDLDYTMEDVEPPADQGEGITFEQYVRHAPDDEHVLDAIVMLSKPELRAPLFVAAYLARREAWGVEAANTWVGAHFSDTQATWLLDHAG